MSAPPERPPLDEPRPHPTPVGERAEPERVVYDLSAAAPTLSLEPAGFRLQLRPGRRHQPLTLYEDVTHAAATGRGFWLATQRGVFFARRSRFRRPGGPEQLATDLLRRIAGQPGGMHQLRRLAEIDHLATHPRPRRATWAAVALCGLLYTLQVSDPFVAEVGAFDPPLARAGEWWRLVTGNFIHALVSLPIHLVLNVLGLLGFGFVVERALGPARTAAVLGAAGVAAMGASGFVRDDPVIGASGLVAGLAGAALCLELHFASRLPAWWRLPRRPFLLLLALQVVIDSQVPLIAGEAHIGGFVAGYAVCGLSAVGAFAGSRTPAPLRLATGATLAALGLAFAAAAPVWLRQPDALAGHARRLLTVEGLPPGRYNDLAWRMATEASLSREQLEAALALAEKAVDGTDRLDPDLLDTLAEVLFAAGRSESAIETIDEAIALAPADEYFREQRRRFTGERAANDRPDPPTLPWMFRQPPQLRPAEDDDPEPELTI